MAKFSAELSAGHQEFIAAQKIYFVASAPTSGRVNLSPKGLNTFRVLGSRRVGYLDGTGSGNETAAHLADNGRITFMFCAFTESPLILRIYGKGRAIHPRDEEWRQFRPLFGAPLPGERQLIVTDIEGVQTSCGFAVPFFNYEGDRQVLTNWAEKKTPEELHDYWAKNNQSSIDGLPTGLLPK
jgi:hypothetical protein